MPAVETAALKVKPEALPPGTPAHERVGKKQKLKPAAESRDYTKVGLFRCKEGMAVSDLIPNDLKKRYCTYFSFHDKKCTNPSQDCKFTSHIAKWDRFPANNQTKILERCHVTQRKMVWLNANTFLRNRVTIPEKYAYLLGDSKGPKSA